MTVGRFMSFHVFAFLKIQHMTKQRELVIVGFSVKLLYCPSLAAFSTLYSSPRSTPAIDTEALSYGGVGF